MQKIIRSYLSDYEELIQNLLDQGYVIKIATPMSNYIEYIMEKETPAPLPKDIMLRENLDVLIKNLQGFPGNVMVSKYVVIEHLIKILNEGEDTE